MHLLIAAAGSGKRMGANCNKLLLEVSGRPVISWTLEAVKASSIIKWVGIVGQPVDKPLIMNLAQDCSKPIKWINGGKTRQESVQLGLAALPPEADYDLIHDGARCLVDSLLLNRCAELVAKGDAV